MVQLTRERFGGLDILVNNAAISRHVAITETSVELYDEVIGVNLKGSFLASQVRDPGTDRSRWRLDREHRLDRGDPRLGHVAPRVLRLEGGAARSDDRPRGLRTGATTSA